MFSLYFLQKPESSAEEQTKPEEKQEVKKSAETLTADIPAPAMESPTTTSKSSRKKKKAAAAAAAVAEFAEMLPQEKEEEPSVGSGNAQEVPSESVVEPAKDEEAPQEVEAKNEEAKNEEAKNEEAEEEFTVTKSKKSKKKKGKVSKESTEKVIHAFVSSRIDSCNALLFGIPRERYLQIANCAK